MNIPDLPDDQLIEKLDKGANFLVTFASKSDKHMYLKGLDAYLNLVKEYRRRYPTTDEDVKKTMF